MVIHPLLYWYAGDRFGECNPQICIREQLMYCMQVAGLLREQEGGLAVRDVFRGVFL
jgi:hypothetical protein